MVLNLLLQIVNKKHTIKGISVTFFDANHCPGSVVILFELPSGETYLHTGDFRFDSSLLTHSLLQKYLPRFRHEIGEDEEIDERACVKKVRQSAGKYEPFSKVFVKNQPRITAVYLDTTYCHPSHMFPKQLDVIEVVAKAVQQKLKQEPKSLFIIGTYQIGKERICARIAELLKCKVYVNWQKFQMMKCLNLPYQHIFTTNINEAGPIHVVPMFDLGWKKLFELRSSVQNKYKEIIAIKPTGWTFTSLKKDDTPSTEKDLDDSQALIEDEDDEKLHAAENENDTSFDAESSKQVYSVLVDKRYNISMMNVPYSEHSAFYELREFVENVQPKQIIPTVYSNQGQKSKQLYFLSEKFNYDYTAIRNTVTIPDEFFEDANTSSSGKKKETSKHKKEEPKKEEKGSIVNFLKKSISKVTSLFSTKGVETSEKSTSVTVTATSTLLIKSNTSLLATPQRTDSLSSTTDSTTTTPASSLVSNSLIIELDNSQESNDSNQNTTSSLNMSLDSSFASSQAPMDDSIDLGSIDIGLQRHILLSLEREKEKKTTPKLSVSSSSSTSTTPASQATKKRPRTEVLASNATNKKKKTEVEQKNSILTFFKPR